MLPKSFLALCLATGVSIVPAAAEIVINEIMYNSPGEDVEFVELYNASDQSIDLTGWYILDDNDAHLPCLISGTLEPGEYLVIAQDIVLFRQNYPGVTSLNPQDYGTGSQGWGLGNSADAVRLYRPDGTLHDAVYYQDRGEWPVAADGDGPSLELLNPALDNALAASWAASTVDGGTPGARNSVFVGDLPPVCRDGSRQIPLPAHDDRVPVTVFAFDYEGPVSVELFVNAEGGYSPQPMSDDGTQGDAAAGDSVFTAIIPPHPDGTLVKYYASATDQTGQTRTWPARAPLEYAAYTVGHVPPGLRITEVLPINDTIIQDPFGDYEDWIEIQNQDDRTVNLGGMYLGNAFDQTTRFMLPPLDLAPGQFLLVWADNQPEQGPLHANFKLSGSGETVALFETTDRGNVLIHGWRYGVTGRNISIGFPHPESTAPEFLALPTPGRSNAESPLFSPVCINEFQTTSNFGGPKDDWIEIYNRGAEPFDLSGCFLSDKRGNNTKWRFPDGTVLQPEAFLTVYEDVLGFGLPSERGGVIMLTAADSITGLDFYDFGPQQPDRTEGRYPDGASTWRFLDSPTPSASNIASVVHENGSSGIPADFRLEQNFPNPFNPETVVRYQLPRRERVRIGVYTLLGTRLRILADEIQEAGCREVVWDGTDDAGKAVSSGIYFYRLETEAFGQTRKMILIR